MAETEQGIVIGVFEDRKAVIQTIEILLKAGFHEDQLGFATRSNEEHIQQVQKQAPTQNSIIRGVVGGLLGVVDMLLVPITGPSDAVGILASVLPATEDAIDHIPHLGQHKEQKAPIEPEATTTPSEPTQTQEKANTEPVVQGATTAITYTTATQQATETAERTSIVTGGVIGGVLGAGAALLLPGIGPIVAGGVLAEVFGGIAIGGIAGGFLGAFTTIGVPEEQARRYEKEIKAGRTILAIHTAQRQQEVVDILLQNGAHDVQTHG